MSNMGRISIDLGGKGRVAIVYVPEDITPEEEAQLQKLLAEVSFTGEDKAHLEPMGVSDGDIEDDPTAAELVMYEAVGQTINNWGLACGLAELQEKGEASFSVAEAKVADTLICRHLAEEMEFEGEEDEKQRSALEKGAIERFWALMTNYIANGEIKAEMGALEREPPEARVGRPWMKVPVGSA